MATMEVFGSLTPDPFVSSHTDVLGKSKDGMDVLAKSGSETPRCSGEVDMAAVQSKLERLQVDEEEGLQDFGLEPAIGPANSSLDADTRTSSTNLELPYPAFIAVPPTPAFPPPPDPHHELFVWEDRLLALQAKPVKSHFSSEQVVSKGSVGHPFSCECHYLGSRAQATALEEKSLAESPSENATLKEAKTLANRLVSLLGGEEPFDFQANEAVKPETFLGTMGHPLTCAEPFESNARLVIDLDAATEFPSTAPILSTNPIWSQPQGYPTPPHQLPWCSSVGSVGHPYNCAPACKYAMKAKGCKDGALCDHCHLCYFKRNRH